MFEPAATSRGPSGLADWPRPFVFRATHLDGRKFAPAETFHFDLNLFDTESTALPYLALAFAQLAGEGLGPRRSRVELTRVAQLDEQGEEIKVMDQTDPSTLTKSAPLAFALDASRQKVERLRMRFVTPTELKCGHELASRPEFGVLAARVRDRISTLRELYGGGALEMDFRGFGERAALVTMTHCDIKNVNMTRTSTRTGQVHSIGGFVGEVEYEGDLSEFVPYLRLAKWTGVGRQTVWGKGEISIE